MELALCHKLFVILLSLRGFALLELQVEVSVVNSTGVSEQPHQQDNGYGDGMQPNDNFSDFSHLQIWM